MAFWRTTVDSVVPPIPIEHERAVERFCTHMDCRRIQHFWDRTKANVEQSKHHNEHRNGTHKWYDGPFHDVYGIHYAEIKTIFDPTQYVRDKDFLKYRENHATP
jgi:hypothetical protein